MDKSYLKLETSNSKYVLVLKAFDLKYKVHISATTRAIKNRKQILKLELRFKFSSSKGVAKDKCELTKLILI